MELAAAVLSLSCKAVSISKELHDLRAKYKDAAATIDAICNETEVVRASLSRVQRLLEKDHAQGYQFDDELRCIFDTAVTGCNVTLSCLEHETNELAQSARDGASFGWRVKAKYLWKEDIMNDLLQKLRGQHGAVALLLQSLQMESLSDLRHFLHDKSGELVKSEAQAKALRKAHPEVDVPESVLGHKEDADSVLGDGASVFSCTEFSFDDEVVNSKAYRRVLLSAAGQRARPKSPALDDVPENEGAESVKTARGSEKEPCQVSGNASTSAAVEADEEAMDTEPQGGDGEFVIPTYSDPPPAYVPPLPPHSQTPWSFPANESITSRPRSGSSRSPSPFSTQPNISPSGSPTLSADPSSFTSRSPSPSPSPPFLSSRTPSPDPLSAAMNKALNSFTSARPRPDPRLATRPPIPAAPLPRLIDELGSEQMDSATDRESSATDTTGRSTPDRSKLPTSTTADTTPTDAAPCHSASSTPSTPTPRARSRLHYQKFRRDRGESLSKRSAKAEARAEVRAAARAKRAEKRAMRRGSAHSGASVYSPTSPSAAGRTTGEDDSNGSPTSRRAARPRSSSSKGCARKDRDRGSSSASSSTTTMSAPQSLLPLDLPPLPPLPRVVSLPSYSDAEPGPTAASGAPPPFPLGLARRATSLGVDAAAGHVPCPREAVRGLGRRHTAGSNEVRRGKALCMRERGGLCRRRGRGDVDTELDLASCGEEDDGEVEKQQQQESEEGASAAQAGPR